MMLRHGNSIEDIVNMCQDFEHAKSACLAVQDGNMISVRILTPTSSITF